MGFWECDDGTKVEMIFDGNGKFIRFADNVSQEDAEKAKKEIQREENIRINHMRLIGMIDKGIPVDEIVKKCSEDNCVSNYGLEVPSWCHEDADCNDCWTKCIENLL